MPTHLDNSERSTEKDLLKQFCETGLHHYISLISEAHSKGDWTLLKELSLRFEKDCYRIGEVEMIGKLIILRMHLHAEPVQKQAVENAVRNIFDLSSHLQEFLIRYLETSNVKLEVKNLRCIMKEGGNYEEVYNSWVYNSCCLQ